MSSKSWTSDLAAWAVTRILRPRILLLAALLTGASCLSQPASVTDGSWIWHAASLFALICTFRLQDDLADIETDRIGHPERVLCLTSFTQQLLVTSQCLRLVMGIAVLILFGGWSLMTFAVLVLVLNGWYQHSRRLMHPLQNAAVVLLKYPCFLIIIVGQSGWPAFAVAAGVYLLLYAVEWRDIQSELTHTERTARNQ